jgi:signal transduction histidine kinase
MAVQSHTTLETVAHGRQQAKRDKSASSSAPHDDLGGLLIGAVMDLSMLSPRLLLLGDDVQQKIIRVRQALESAIELTRRLPDQSRPTLLDNVGLFAASRWLLKNACAHRDVYCIDCFPSEEPQLASAHFIALFRSVQEALIITLERDGVTTLTVVGKVADSTLSFQIIADGTSLLEELHGPRALMLESIRHRIYAWDGAVTLNRMPEGGIELSMTCPIKYDFVSTKQAAEGGTIETSKLLAESRSGNET